MIVFADSSAVVARYSASETDVMVGVDGLVVSDLARVEVVSALWRQGMGHGLGPEETHAVVRRFESDWHADAPRFRSIAIIEDVLTQAARLAVVHGLRTLDAIQLASALATRAAEPECRTMAVLDERLRRAAAAEGFTLLP